MTLQIRQYGPWSHLCAANREQYDRERTQRGCKRVKGLRGNQEAAHGLHGPSSPMPPMQPELSLEPSGQRRRSTLDAELRYQPRLMLSVAMVVPTIGHEEPVVQGSHDTTSSSGSLS